MQLPVLNMIICGICSAIIALFFDIEKLVEFMSIGTLMAYTIVSASVIILRYQPAHRSLLLLLLKLASLKFNLLCTFL